MKTCDNCGSPLAEGKRFCMECGTPAAASAQPEPKLEFVAMTDTEQPRGVQAAKPQSAQPARPQPPAQGQPKRRQNGTAQSFAFSDPEAEPPSYSRYAVMSTGDFVGVMLLMIIPVVNIVLLIVWAFGGKKINRRNWARAYLIVTLIGIALGVTVSLLFGSAVISLLTKDLSSLP